MSERIEPLLQLHLIHGLARISHERIFDFHMALAAAGADDERTRALMRESAAIALKELPALTKEAHRLADQWDEQALLDHREAEATLEEFYAELERIRPELERLNARQTAIVSELQSRIKNL